MSDLQKFKDRILGIKEEILKQKRTPEFEAMKEFTSSEEFRTRINKYADITVKMINKDINPEDYKVAMAMVRATVDYGIVFLMEKYGVQFLKKK